MLRRLALLVALVLSACAANPVFAQTATFIPEPPPEPGTVVVRIANTSDCPLAVRMKRDGDVIGVALVPAKTKRLHWVHAQPGPTTIYEVEILVAPQLCGVPSPSQNAPPPAPPLPVVPLAPVSRANWRRG